MELEGGGKRKENDRVNSIEIDYICAGSRYNVCTEVE
jgi:hypothetical protein